MKALWTLCIVAWDAVEWSALPSFAGLTPAGLLLYSKNMSIGTQRTSWAEVKWTIFARTSHSSNFLDNLTIITPIMSVFSISIPVWTDCDEIFVVFWQFVLFFARNWLQKHALLTQAEVASRFTTTEITLLRLGLCFARIALNRRTTQWQAKRMAWFANYIALFLTWIFLGRFCLVLFLLQISLFFGQFCLLVFLLPWS